MTDGSSSGSAGVTEPWGLVLRLATQPIEVLVELEDLRDRIGLAVGDLNVSYIPPGERSLHVGAARAAGQGTSAPGRKAVEEHRGIGGGGDAGRDVVGGDRRPRLRECCRSASLAGIVSRPGGLVYRRL